MAIIHLYQVGRNSRGDGNFSRMAFWVTGSSGPPCGRVQIWLPSRGRGRKCLWVTVCPKQHRPIITIWETSLEWTERVQMLGQDVS